MAMVVVQLALAMAAAAASSVDAALVSMDLALRHRLFDPPTHAALNAAADGLFGGEAA
jgi:hypothetical protein